MRWTAMFPWRGTVVLLLALSCAPRKAEVNALSDPGNAEAWETLGNAHRRRLQQRRAADAYRMALSLDPERVGLQVRISGKLSREARQIRRAARRHPGDDEFWGDLGDILHQEGDLSGARAAYFRAFRIDPQDSEWQQGLAAVGAGELVLSILRPLLDPEDDESLGDFADILAATGQREEACEHWRQAVEVDPSDEEWIEHAVRCGFEVPDRRFVDTGMYDDFDGGVEGGVIEGIGGTVRSAPDDLSSLVARVRSDVGLLVRLGQAYIKAKEPAKAEETLWGAVLVAPTNEEALQSYLIATSKTRREVLERLRNAFPENDEVIGLLGDHYLDLGLRDKAREMYDLAHGLDADDPEWQAKRALLVR